MNDIMKMYLKAFKAKDDSINYIEDNNKIIIKESIVSVPKDQIYKTLNLNELRDVIVRRAVENYLNNKD